MKLSVLMMVKNGASTIERAITPLAGIAGEVCLHDTGSTDNTTEIVRSLCERLDIKCWAISSNHTKNPVSFFSDTERSFVREVPYWKASFTGQPLLADWSWGLNSALALCQGDYVLRMDADDVAVEPQDILPTLAMLDARLDIDIVSSTYEVMNPKTNKPSWKYMSDRLWRRGEVKYERVMHEKLVPKRHDNYLMAAKGLLFRDMRDSSGEGIRVLARNAKTLLRNYEAQLYDQPEEDLDPEFLFTLGHEMVPFDPGFAIRLLDKAFGELPAYEPEILYHMGRCYEVQGLWGTAIAKYTEASHLGNVNALLARAKFADNNHIAKLDIEEAEALAKKMGYFNVDLELLERAKNGQERFFGSAFSTRRT